MGTRGPAPTPTEILKQRGSWRAKTRKGEPTAETVTSMTPPTWLEPEAKRMFRREVRRLGCMKVLVRNDREALARYCDMVTEYHDLRRQLRENAGRVEVYDKEGNVITYRAAPEVGRVTRLRDQILRLEAQFGLTPSSRTQVRAVETGKADGGLLRFKKARPAGEAREAQ